MIPIEHTIIFSSTLLFLGLLGMMINRKNLIALLMCLELMLLAVNTNFIAFSHHFNQVQGQVFVFFVLTVAAAESAIGLAIFVAFYRRSRSISVLDATSLKG